MIPKIQLALDCMSIQEALSVLKTGVADEVDIIECGYCLLAKEGTEVVKTIRALYPDKEILADPKIVDAGSKISSAILEGKPDYITILCACEPGTITSIDNEIKKRGLNTKMQIELYGHWQFEDVAMWKELGITQLTLQHSGDKPGTWDEEELATLKKLITYGIPVAPTGAIGYDQLDLFKGLPISTFIFGRAIKDAKDPVAEARKIRKKINELFG